MPRMDYLDALRGLAILGVLLVHSGQAAPGLPEGLSGATAYGARGVQLFYMVSAFTMMTISQNGLEPRSFFIRRFFRIAPMFYLAIITFLVLQGLGPRYYAPEGVNWHQIVLAFTFLHGWRPDAVNAIVPGGWSIACEMMFYVIFPLLRAVVTTFLRSIVAFVVAVGVAMVTIYGREQVIPGGSGYLVHDFLFFTVFAQAPVFMAGFVVYFLPRSGFERLALPAGIVAVTLLILLAFGGPRLSHYFLSIPPLALLVWAMATKPLPVLNSPAIRSIGLISFSLYLTHQLILDPLKDNLTIGGVPQLIIVYAATLAGGAALSLLTYRYVEQPMIRLGRMLSTPVPKIDKVSA